MKPFVFVSENIALGKPATQLGTYRDYDAGQAVDGDMRQYLLEGSCAHPHSEDLMLPDDVRLIPAWWQVDLSDGDPTRTYVIRNVTIYFRLGHEGKTTYLDFCFPLLVVSLLETHDSRDQISCADVRPTRAWWQVDLSDGDPTMTYVIRNVTIYFRWGNSGELGCMKVLFSIKNTPDVLDGFNYYRSLFFKLLYELALYSLYLSTFGLNCIEICMY